MFRFCSYLCRRRDSKAAPLATWTLILAPLLSPALAVALVPVPAVAGERLAGPLAARVERVIDGDSLAVRVRVWLGLEVTTVVRLRGIDAPELAGRCPAERRRAVAARDALAGLVGGGEVRLAGVETDKYGGRVVADVSDPGGRPLAAVLVDAGLARPYDGGRRAGWCG